MSRVKPGGDYEGALVVETAPGTIVLTHPDGDLRTASLPADPCLPGEAPHLGAVRIVAEMTGLVVEVIEELTSFVQEGTPTGTMCAHGFLARPTGGTLVERGPAGPVRAHHLDALPPIIEVRVAVQRVLADYLARRAPGGG